MNPHEVNFPWPWADRYSSCPLVIFARGHETLSNWCHGKMGTPIPILHGIWGLLPLFPVGSPYYQQYGDHLVQIKIPLDPVFPGEIPGDGDPHFTVKIGILGTYKCLTKEL